MTDDDIRALALSHGFTLREQPDGRMDLNPYVYEFARALISAEREACAAIADDSDHIVDGRGCYDQLGDAKMAAANIAAAIRARKG